MITLAIHTAGASARNSPHQKTHVSARVQRARRGGSWLVTYADLMTILVCFFVLIVSFSIQDQVKLEVVAGSMRDAFGVAEERRYAGDVKMIGTPDQLQPGNVRPSPTPTASAINETLTARPAAGTDGFNGAFAADSDNKRELDRAAARMMQAILTHPLLKDKSDSVRITMVDDGLQIVLIDDAGQAMFKAGSADLTPRARQLLGDITEYIIPLPNLVTVEGHADAQGSGQYSAFDLTVLRANNARKVLQDAGLSEDRIDAVAGRGSGEPLYVDDPYAAANRRIEILLKKAAPLLPPNRLL